MAYSIFTPHERATLEAAMARIIPTDDTPGAREAGCIEFLERYLSGIDYIFAKPDGSGFEILSGQSAAAWKKRIEIMRERYFDGIKVLDARSNANFGVDFVELGPTEQDSILRKVEQAAIETPPMVDAPDAWANPSSAKPALQQTSTEVELGFLPLLVIHTRQGFYSDPIYGGNRDRLGWSVIGFPGPASLKEVHSGRYSTLEYFAEGEADKVREFHVGL